MLSPLKGLCFYRVEVRQRLAGHAAMLHVDDNAFTHGIPILTPPGHPGVVDV